MKISVVCLCVFSFCTLYWAFGTTLSFASAEDAVLSTSISASIDSSDDSNNTVSASTDGDDKPSEHNVIKSDGELEPSADIHFSIEELINEEKEEPVHKQEYAFVEAVSQNSGIAHEVAGTSPGVIHTVVDSATLELQEKAEELSAAAASTIASPSHHNETPTLEKNNLTNGKSSVIIDSLTEPLNKENNISVEINLEQRSEDISDSNNTQQTDQRGTEVPSIEPKSNVTEQEEIPSFSEWAQKQLEEAERKREQDNSSIPNQQSNGKSNSGIKKRWKNYASPDCGSKIIAANPEAVSAGSVLSSSRDEYKLNTCTSRVWFIVELCEAIQAKKIDLANFELFSSSPKDFSISVSDRFPSRDWSSVGHFTAKDERDIQSFDLHPHLFGKYIKFEMHSHHGSEHYCPISLFRVYGTSEFEVLETENQVHTVGGDDDDDEETLDAGNGEPTKNLFSSATDAVISIVKKAAEVLGNKGNISTAGKDDQNNTVVKYTPLISTCTTPSHLVICNNCSDLLFGTVFELLSCNSRQLTQLVSQAIIKNALYNTDVCSTYGFDFCSKSTSTNTVPNNRKSFITSFFAAKYVAAMCNTVAVNECKVVLNISSANATSTLTSQDINKISTKLPEPTIISSGEPIPPITEIPTPEVITEHLITTATETNTTEISYTSQIKPTKTLTPEEDLNLTVASVNVDPSGYEQTVHSTTTATPQGQNDSSSGMEDKAQTQLMDNIELSSEIVGDMEATTESAEGLDEHLEALVTELNGDSSSNIAAATVSPPTTPQGQKESVFLRLSNRIKALERNMSLSSQYLEELSRRYKRQVEEMQRLLEKTITTLNEENKKKDERTHRLEEQISSLREAVETLVAEKNTWLHTTYWIFLIIVILGTMLFCRRNTEFKHPRIEDKTNPNEVQRRKSVDVITHKTPVKKKRRPSEEALMVGGTYTHLLIDEVDASSTQRTKDKKRKKKKSHLQRSNSITTLNEETTDNDDHVNRTINSDKGFYFAPKSTSSQIWRRQESAPPNLPLDWIDSAFKCDTLQDIPFVLEESEHSSLEPMSYIPVLNQKNVKVNGNAPQATTFTVTTATDTRAKRMFGKQKNGKSKTGHKKSASFDETKRHKTPSPPPIQPDTTSLLSNSFEDPSILLEAPKKEKKSTFKRLFRNFNFK